MKCPHCKQDLHLPSYAERNMESCGNPCLTVALCCGKPVRVHPVTTFRATAYTGEQTHDDWGKAIKQTEKAS